MAEPSAEHLSAFYRRLYPFKSIFNWLNHEHAPTKLFTHREFSFTLPGDIYIRYNSFANAEDMKKQVCALNPTRFDIGPVYNSRPKDRKTARVPLAPLHRELVFDIDMTDYDPIRTCCSGADICSRCWAFISAAVHVLHSALRDQFGFKHMMWVYSGRRGIHLWISDKEAMDLTDEQRKAMVGYLTVIVSEKQKMTLRTPGRPLPPSLDEALSYLQNHVFVGVILRDQDLFSSEQAWNTVLDMFPDKNHLITKMEALKVEKDKQNKKNKDIERIARDANRTESERKWILLADVVLKEKEMSKAGQANFDILQEIMLKYTYPRLDTEVSKHRNHLLKAPFVIHPKTGRVCVPVDPDRIDDFNPEKVPTIYQLLEELDNFKSDGDDGHHSDWEKTSLKPYVDMLDKFTLGLINEVKREKRETDMTW